ncbi:PHD-finger domain-containing protein [Apiospora kogelbergensis]|uniref:PHD-finger domain-containing protein n=1 Tax=Apiospora kogelbergensis TaxID=1337665 RepID=UPI003130916B
MNGGKFDLDGLEVWSFGGCKRVLLACEDRFHGECIDLDKKLGEKLVERFVCPDCTDGDLNHVLPGAGCDDDELPGGVPWLRKRRDPQALPEQNFGFTTMRSEALPDTQSCGRGL